MGYIGQILGDIFGKTMGYTVPLDILNKTNGCLGNIMGYIGKQLWDILSDICQNITYTLSPIYSIVFT